MTKEQIIQYLENNIKEIEKLLDYAKTYFVGPEKLESLGDILPKPICFKIEEEWVKLDPVEDPVEWEFVTKVYL